MGHNLTLITLLKNFIAVQYIKNMYQLIVDYLSVFKVESVAIIFQKILKNIFKELKFLENPQ